MKYTRRDTTRGVACAADMLIDRAKKLGKERTQTTARRNQNNSMLTSGGGVEPLTHCLSQDIPTAVSYLPLTLHHSCLPTINYYGPTLARVIHHVYLRSSCSCSGNYIYRLHALNLHNILFCDFRFINL